MVLQERIEVYPLPSKSLVLLAPCSSAAVDLHSLYALKSFLRQVTPRELVLNSVP